MKSPRGKLLTTVAGAEYLGVSVPRMRRIIKSGELAVLRKKNGRFDGVYEADCEEWIARRRQSATGKRSPGSVAVDAAVERLAAQLSHHEER